MILAGWPQLQATFGISLFNIEPNGKEIRVMSYNLRHFALKKANNKEINKAKRAIDFIQRKTPDILCLQEARSKKEIYQYIDQNLDLHHHFQFHNSNTILSKYPLVKKFSKRFPNSKNSFQYVDIVVGQKDTIRVFNVHFQSLRFGSEDYSTLNKPKFEEQEQIQTVLRKIVHASRARAEQVEEVKEHLKQTPYPVILCGDFNDTPSSFTYRQISTVLFDTFRAKGTGIEATYAGPIPGLRIDYIFASNGFRVFNHVVQDYEFSDHYPVITEMELLK